LKKINDEILFQYIDNELSEAERLEVETELSRSVELQNRLDELKNITCIPKLVQPLDPSPYFAQQLIENKFTSRKNLSIKKYAPVFIVIVLTAALMLFYKYNLSEVDKIVRESGGDLLSYYTKNLKPLFMNTRLDEDDVFNFAFNRIVPLDREKNQYLSIGVNESGKEYFEIRNNLDIKNFHSKDEFVNQLKLSEKQTNELNNLLSGYAKNLEGQVVISEDNAIGVNENLWTLNRAIVANVLQFAETASSKSLNQIVTPTINFISNPRVNDFINFAVQNKSNKYVLLTPDTIFSTPIEINLEKFEKQREEIEKQKEEIVIILKDKSKRHKIHEDELKKLSKELENLKVSINIDTSAKIFKLYKHKSRPFRIEIDEEKFHIEIPEIEKIDIPNIDSIMMNIEIARDKIHAFRFKSPDGIKIPSKKFKIDIKILKDSLKSLEMNLPNVMKWKMKNDSLENFKLKIEGLDSLIELSMKEFKEQDWEKFGWQMDSLGKRFDFHFDIENFDKEKFKKDMNKLKDELKKLKYEYKYELKPNEKKKKPEEV